MPVLVPAAAVSPATAGPTPHIRPTVRPMQNTRKAAARRDCLGAGNILSSLRAERIALNFNRGAPSRPRANCCSLLQMTLRLLVNSARCPSSKSPHRAAAATPPCNVDRAPTADRRIFSASYRRDGIAANAANEKGGAGRPGQWATRRLEGGTRRISSCTVIYRKPAALYRWGHPDAA